MLRESRLRGQAARLLVVLDPVPQVDVLLADDLEAALRLRLLADRLKPLIARELYGVEEAA